MKKRIVSVILATMMLLTGCGRTVNELTVEGTNEGGNDSGNVSVVDVISAMEAPDNYAPLQKFSYGLFGENVDETNPVLSPVSAYLAVALTGTGARGETLDEFQNVMGDMERIPYDLMVGLPKDEEGMQIALANSVWLDKRLTPNQEWLAGAGSIYKADVFQAQLATTETMKQINLWIHENTNGLIPQLLSEPLNDDIRLALINTIYFKGEWMKRFGAIETREREFVLEDGTIEMVNMMQMQQENLLYVKNDIAEGVVLPYKDVTKAFVALKPLGEEDVRQMYEMLSTEDISMFLQQEEKTLCNLRLPKFQVEFEKNLNDSLKAMGLEKAFVEGEADLSGLGVPDNGLGMYIDLVFQKAKVIVDEEGTEAAAVTIVEVATESCPMYEEPPIDIYFDEPFLYMIMDVEREVPLFIGIMDNPNA